MAVILTGKQRRHLRALGHSLDPAARVGKAGVTQGLLDEIDRALEVHELVKLKVERESPLGVDEAAERISAATGSSVAQVIGRTLLVYRPRKKDPKIRLPARAPASRLIETVMYAPGPSSFDTIVVGIDFSETGARALAEALQLAAERDGAKLHVAHVAGPVGEKVEIHRDDGVHVMAVDEAVKMLEGHVEAARVAAISGGEPIESERVEVHLRIGTCEEELLELGRTLGAGLLVVGTHGRSGVKRLVLGSIAESVMKTAPCPVMIVRPKAYPEPEAEP